MIAYPSSYPRIYTRKTVAAMVGFIWFFSLALLVPTLAERWGTYNILFVNDSFVYRKCLHERQHHHQLLE